MMTSSPPDHIHASPDDSNILVWYYVLDGPKDTPYEGGKYFGKVKFPPDYPFAPPSIMMSTPNGRFKTDTRLCLSISDFHPKEWNPVWNSATILTGLLSFMVGSDQTHGSMESSAAFKKELAKKSHKFNVQQPMYRKLFPVQYAESMALLGEKSADIEDVARPTGRNADGDEERPSKSWEDYASTALQVVILGCIIAACGYVFVGTV